VPLPAPADATEAVRHGALPVVVVPRQPIEAGRPLEVTVLSNPSRLDSIVATGRVLDLLHHFAQERIEARLSAAGLDRQLANPVDIVEQKVGNAAGFAGIMLTMIPPFLMFTLFIGGVHVVLDATSGERERGSFEPLLINPVTRRQVLIGKLGAGFVFTLMALGAQLFAFWFMLSLVSAHLGGIAPPPDPLRLLLLVPVSLPVALLAVATQLMISAVTRSMKEAQTYLGLLPLVPGIAGMVLALAPVQIQPLLAAIPTFGQTLLMGQVVRHERLSGSLIGISIVATLAATLLLLALAFRLYQREEILFPK
jgi:sodium transport system permease protein